MPILRDAFDAVVLSACVKKKRWWSKSHSNFVSVDNSVPIKSVQICYLLRSAGCIFQEAKNDDTILIMEQSKMKITIQNCGFSIRLAVPVWQQAHWDDTHSHTALQVNMRASECVFYCVFVCQTYSSQIFFSIQFTTVSLCHTDAEGLSACICLRYSFVGTHLVWLIQFKFGIN